MDEFLALVGVQAMRYAIRSSIALASTYAIGQLSYLVKSADDHEVYARLKTLYDHFESKVKVISPVIDLIELKSGRGNIFLESAAPMTEALQRDITSLSSRIDHTLQSSKAPNTLSEPTRRAAMGEVRVITQDLQQLLDRVDREIPLLQLAISASGESLSTSLPPSISPSRLLQASTLLVVGDIQYSRDPAQAVQIGPAFCLSVYMLFQAHATLVESDEIEWGHGHRECDHKPAYGIGPFDRKPLWQEIIHKARLRLQRKPIKETSFGDHVQAQAYYYQLNIAEDLNDGRFHDDGEGNSSQAAGSSPLQDILPVREVSKLFYTDTGSILNLGHDDAVENNPVLLLKRDVGETSDSGTSDDAQRSLGDIASVSDEKDHDEQSDVDRQLLNDSRAVEASSPLLSFLRSATHLNHEWLAFELFEESDNLTEESEYPLSDYTSEETFTSNDSPLGSCRRRSIADGVENLTIRLPQSSEESSIDAVPTTNSPLAAITYSLSLLEMLIRLAGLQEFQQTSHLAIPDHVLTFFLEETSSTGLAGGSQWKARAEAKSKIGFDPYMDKKE